MVKHNNVLPNVHFHKYWVRYVKTWFNQPARKLRRRLTRQRKAARIAPRPVAGSLRPIVHCQTQRYNMRERAGKGFTIDEIKAAGVSKGFAKQMGIAVDHRRKNRCQESLDTNTARLKAYVEKLVVFPKGQKVKKGDTPRDKLKDVVQNTHKDIIPIVSASKRVKARAIQADEKDAQVYQRLRRELMLTKKNGKYQARLKEEAEKAAAAK